MTASDVVSPGRRLANWFLISGSRRWVALALAVGVVAVGWLAPFAVALAVRFTPSASSASR